MSKHKDTSEAAIIRRNASRHRALGHNTEQAIGFCECGIDLSTGKKVEPKWWSVYSLFFPQGKFG